MPDTLLTELASHAGAAAHPPPFDELARRGHRLRRNRTLGAGAAVVAVLTVTVLGVQGVYDDQSAPIPPTRPTAPRLPSPALTDHSRTPLENLTPQQIVYDENAELSDAVAVPSSGGGGLASVCLSAAAQRASRLSHSPRTRSRRRRTWTCRRMTFPR